MNLTLASLKIKKGFKYFLAGMAAYYLIFFVLFPQARMLIARYLPEKDPPSVTYGKLPKLVFENKKIVNGTVKYELNTKGGQVPLNFPKKMVVFKYREPQFSYLAGRNAQDNATALGFNNHDLISDLKSDVFEWKSYRATSNLRIELMTNRLFVYTTLDRMANLITNNVIKKESVIPAAESIFKKIGRFDDTYSAGSRSVTYGKIYGNTVLQSFDKEEANIARVDLYRKLTVRNDSYAVFGPDPRDSNLNVTIGTQKKQPDPLNNPNMDAVYWEIITEDMSGTYPVYFISDVWNIIKDNRGVISGIYPKNYNPFEDYTPVFVERVLINNIYLAYYESRDFQPYLQPIYVFEGKYTARGSEGGDIVLYYPAVKPEFIKE